MRTTPAVPQAPAWALELSIAGEPVLGGAEPVAVFDPATEGVLAEVPQADAEQVDRAIVAARRAFDDGPWRTMSAEERSKLLFRFADCPEARKDDLINGTVFECGTPVTQTRIGQVELPITVLRSYAELARKDRTEHLGLNLDMAPSDSLVAYQPVGVVGVITA